MAVEFTLPELGENVEKGDVVRVLVSAGDVIARIDRGIAAPPGAEVIDATGKFIYPGMIDANTGLGLSEIGSIQTMSFRSELGDFNPHIRALVGLNVESELLGVTRMNGVTTVIVTPSGGAISETIGDLQRASGAAERLSELRAERPVIVETASPKTLPVPAKGAIDFDAVSFRYPTRSEHLALDQFDLNIAPGETVAIVGPSGAGKTTVFNLLLRFYDPETGMLRIDGVDARDLRLADLRRTMAIVPQEPVLFTARLP